MKPNTSLTISTRRAASAKKRIPRPSPAIPGKLTFSRSVSVRESATGTEAIRSGHQKFAPSQKSASFEWWLSRISRSRPTQVTAHEWTAIYAISFINGLSNDEIRAYSRRSPSRFSL